METIDVPEVKQLPELSANEEDPVAFADMVLTCLLGHEGALLYAEHDSSCGSVGWRIEPRNEANSRHDIEVAISPSLGSFRSVLARFAFQYMGREPYNGYALRFLRQGNRVRRCYFYLSNNGQTGFWIRVYASAM